MEPEAMGQETLYQFHVQLETFLNVSLTSACFILKPFLFSSKKQKLCSWNYPLQVSDYRPFQIIGRHIKGILLYFIFAGNVLKTIVLCCRECQLPNRGWREICASASPPRERSERLAADRHRQFPTHVPVSRHQ